MTNKEAITIIQMERNHCATHNRDAGMSEEYHKEMQSLVDAFDLAIKVLEERPRGKWIRTGSLGNGNAQYECSNCHHGDEHAESQEVPYCWHCGADMRGTRQ